MSICERCEKPATVHVTEVTGGEFYAVHLCDVCAVKAGFVQSSQAPIQELLKGFLRAQEQMFNVPGGARASDAD